MDVKRILQFGGVVAGVVMIAFGVVSIALGLDARDVVRTELKRELIVGSPDMSPAEIEKAVQEAGLKDVPIPSCNVAEKKINTGSQARCFAQYMRIHALESSGGNTYAQMGRFVSAANPSDKKGTSDEAAAAKDEKGKPIANGPRNTWVTETALATALNVSFMAERLGLFTIIIGIALLLSGIGFIILALGVLHGGGLRKPAAS
jgi:ABC-type lipoprotein release transport system permease subunit